MSEIEDIIQYNFSNAALLEEALTHPSFARNGRAATANNQRLEFLGDAVLGLVVAQMLYRIYPNENEGDLAKRHAALVRGEALVHVAEHLQLGRFIRMADSEEAAGGRGNRSNLEDVCEAIIGAMYLDGGLEPAEKFILTHWQDVATNTAAPPKDAKTALQEWAQARGKPLPAYTTISTEGPSHAPMFTIEVNVDGLPPMQASGASKKTAEQLAAKALLEKAETLS